MRPSAAVTTAGPSIGFVVVYAVVVVAVVVCVLAVLIGVGREWQTLLPWRRRRRLARMRVEAANVRASRTTSANSVRPTVSSAAVSPSAAGPHLAAGARAPCPAPAPHHRGRHAA